ncbi:MAG: hypothetical protein WCF68_09220 [Terriglobales bacterium]
MPLDGSGKAEVVPGTVVPKTFLAGVQAGLSPDAKRLAFVVAAVNQEAVKPEDKIVLVTLDSPAAALRLLNADSRITGNGVQFTPDGKALAYAIRENGVNIWLQPLDESPGRKITNFSSEQIVDFRWSPDGKYLGLLRTHSESDVVLLQDSKP